MKSITIITNKYPNDVEKDILVFVQQLGWGLADLSWECNIISPIPINIRPKLIKLPYFEEEETDNGNIIKIYRPRYFGFGQTKLVGINPTKVTTHLFTKACLKTMRQNNINSQVVYGHFITPAGISAARISKEFGMPAVLGFGESTNKTIVNFGQEDTRKELENIEGVIAVSSRNKQLLINELGIDKTKIKVFPNGFNSKRFYRYDKKMSREYFSLPQDVFIVSFVGSLDERKGIKRLEEAINQLDDVYLICAGSGKLKPTSEKVLFCDNVRNEDLAKFYSASDVFVLPTLNEGCSNAIVEAIACELPIISSNKSFNDEILNHENSIRINSESVFEIKEAIRGLNENKLRKMSKASKKKSLSLTIEERSKNISKYLENIVNMRKDNNDSF